MKRLLLTTAAVLALGIGGAFAQGASTSGGGATIGTSPSPAMTHNCSPGAQARAERQGQNATGAEANGSAAAGGCTEGSGSSMENGSATHERTPSSEMNSSGTTEHHGAATTGGASEENGGAAGTNR